jgi:hypothetical protein
MRMRLLPTRPGKLGGRRRGRGERTDRSPQPSPPDAPEARAPAVPAPAGGLELFDERRMRESGGPDDRAMYTCSCGYVFEADVSTSVTCPHCGTGQAW